MSYDKIQTRGHALNQVQPTVMAPSVVRNYDRVYNTKVAITLGSVQIVCGIICIVSNVSVKCFIFIAVYIDSLVMISIEKSETNKNRALEIRDKFVLDWANAKSMAKIQYKFHGPRLI